jgi:hypothetical protein
MTPADIAAMRADMEAGTRGEWAVDPLGLGLVGDISTADGSSCVAQAQARMPLASGMRDAERNANARRIARVPAMERAILDRDAEIARLKAGHAEYKAARDAARDARGAIMRKQEAEIARLMEALAFYTVEENWFANGPLDGSSPNWTGGPARAALKGGTP